ncbi:hypothetical protein ACH4C6_07570 [Streptomyces sp. NPDC017943]|uniref:hypothetical protein n=1 Tax=Streptomyces sp. NPDC017943 TaxID=3365019 RepID=UPI00378A4E9C
MRLTVTHGDNRVEIVVDGEDAATLEAAEGTARRLLADAPRCPPPQPGPAEPFGFGLSSDTERLPEE